MTRESVYDVDNKIDGMRLKLGLTKTLSSLSSQIPAEARNPKAHQSRLKTEAVFLETLWNEE